MSVAGLILAGGRSSRMGGEDKTLMLLGGQPLVERAPVSYTHLDVYKRQVFDCPA